MPDTHDLKGRIRALGNQYVEKRTNAALVIALRQRGTNNIQGFRKVSPNQPVLPDGCTIVEIGSVTKVFTCLALASMAAEGKVNADDAIGSILPREVASPQRGGHQITLRHLATHTAGLPRLPENLDLSDANATNPYALYAAAELYKNLASVKLTSIPGSAMDYSNYGAGLLGHLLALKAGRSYEELILQSICKPLGLHDTVFQLSVEQQARLAGGHNPKGAPVPPWNFDVMAPAGAWVPWVMGELRPRAVTTSTTTRRASDACGAPAASINDAVGTPHESSPARLDKHP